MSECVPASSHPSRMRLDDGPAPRTDLSAPVNARRGAFRKLRRTNDKGRIARPLQDGCTHSQPVVVDQDFFATLWPDFTLAMALSFSLFACLRQAILSDASSHFSFATSYAASTFIFSHSYLFFSVGLFL
jgi:hypothetical protein